jgi:hypothetical protein
VFARLLTLDEVVAILRVWLPQVRLLAQRGADPLPLAVAFLARATLHTTDGDAAATAGEGDRGARGVVSPLAGGGAR